MGGTGRKVQNVWDDAVDTATEAVQDAKSTVEEFGEDTKRTVDETVTDAQRTVEEYDADVINQTERSFVPETLRGSPDPFGGMNKDKDRDSTGETPTPELPSEPQAGEQASESVKKRRRLIAKSRSIYTSPLGVGGQANIIKNFLTGQ